MPRRPITDSPWFWLLVIVNFAFLGLVIVAPRYAQRQAAIERRFQGRQEIARRLATSEPAPAESDVVEVTPSETEVIPSETPVLVVPLSRLQTVLGVLLMVATALFWWAHHRQPSEHVRQT